MNVRQKLWSHGLLVLGDGGRELALLDVVQPPQLLHADLEVPRPLDLRQFAEERDVRRCHFVDVSPILQFQLLNILFVS